jgi:hypothetical protein
VGRNVFTDRTPDRLAALVLFPTLSALGFKTLFIDSLPDALKLAMNQSCLPSAPLRLAYTGVPVLDGVLCSIVAFFDAGLHSSTTPYMAWLLFNLAPITVFMLAEGSRTGGSIWTSPVSAVSCMLCGPR